jgi:hypothetical protein
VLQTCLNNANLIATIKFKLLHTWADDLKAEHWSCMTVLLLRTVFMLNIFGSVIPLIKALAEIIVTLVVLMLLFCFLNLEKYRHRLRKYCQNGLKDTHHHHVSNISYGNRRLVCDRFPCRNSHAYLQWFISSGDQTDS